MFVNVTIALEMGFPNGVVTRPETAASAAVGPRIVNVPSLNVAGMLEYSVSYTTSGIGNDAKLSGVTPGCASGEMSNRTSATCLIPAGTATLSGFHEAIPTHPGSSVS